jgi:serine-type D-Ala-D-Ala carboxypeptidase/endopeptidase
LIRKSHPKQKVGDYISPTCLPISPMLANITLDQLVNYTSGLPNDFSNDDANATTPRLPPQPYSLPALLSYLEKTPPHVSPTEKYTYSNLAFALMSAILAAGLAKEEPTVAAFVSKMRDHIFTPLHMDDTKYFDEVSLVGFPRGYDYANTPTYTAMQAGHPFFPAYFGEAGIVTTPNDMYKWLLFNMGITKDEQLTPLLPVVQTPLATMVDDDGEGLGLGWFIDPKGDTWPASIRKDGELDGFQSFIEFLPSLEPLKTPSQAGVFVLVNASGINAEPQFGKNTTLAAGLADEVLGIMLGG